MLSSLDSRLRHRPVGRGEGCHDLFQDPDFLFRTVTPELLDTCSIDALVTTDDTWLIERDGVAAGLWSFRSLEMYSWGVSQLCGYYELFYRLRGDLPMSSWVDVYQAIIGYLSSKNDIVRITFPVPEFDETGRRAAVMMGFTPAGTLSHAITTGRSSNGMIAYTRTYEPDGPA